MRLQAQGSAITFRPNKSEGLCMVLRFAMATAQPVDPQYLFARTLLRLTGRRMALRNKFRCLFKQTLKNAYANVS